MVPEVAVAMLACARIGAVHAVVFGGYSAESLRDRINALAAFVTLKEGRQGTDALREELKNHVSKKIGALAKPDDILFSADLPKTRSGKIMRRLLKDIAEGRALGDTTTLADPAVVAKLRDQYESQET